MYVYAQLNSEGICVAISSLSEVVESPSLVPIDEYNVDYMWRKYEDGEWSEEKFEPEPAPAPHDEIDKVEQLEQESALLALELAMAQIRIDQAEQEQAELLLHLVSEGVI